MTSLSKVHALLDSVLPLPDDIPKVYMLGDTGAGKSTVLQHLLGTKDQFFPSTLKRRTTVAITEYVLDKGLPFESCFLLKTHNEVKASIEEIVEYSQSQLVKLIRANKDIDIKEVVDNLGESPDQRFRLKYLLDESQLREYAKRLASYAVSRANDLSDDEESFPMLQIGDELFDLVVNKLREQANIELQDEPFPFKQKYTDLASCVESAKLFLKSGKDSLSPLVSYARIQGAFGAKWLNDNARLVIIDGEGIGHDIKESAVLSARHIDYFDFCDAIVLAEGAGKPFAAGGKSAVVGIIQNGYVDRFSLLITKLDELIDSDEESKNSFEDRIQDVKRSYKNPEQALESEGVYDDRWRSHAYYIENLKDKAIPDHSIQQLNALLSDIFRHYSRERAIARRPEYDLEMLSAYLEKASTIFHNEWNRVLNVTKWQSLKAFNRRMVWKEDEYKDLKPVAQLHNFILKALRSYILNPKSWPGNISEEEKKRSIDQILQRFSVGSLFVVRQRLLLHVDTLWQQGMALHGAGSTPKRKRLIEEILDESVPHYDDQAGIEFKDLVKNALVSAMELED